MVIGQVPDPHRPRVHGSDQPTHVVCISGEDIGVAARCQHDHRGIDDVLGARLREQSACAVRIGLIEHGNVAAA
jgi:hypothetical protein